MKLQEMIDAAFGAQEVCRVPQTTSDAVLERERAFQERGAMIETLRAARLADAGKSGHETFVFEVVRYRGHWRTLHNGKRSTPFADQAAAILAAKKLARLKIGDGHVVQVILRRTDGESVIQSIDTDECCSSND